MELQVSQSFNPTLLQTEFLQKNSLLSSRFISVSPEEYIDSIYGRKDELIVVLGSVKDKEGRIVEKGSVIRVHTEDLWKLFWRSNAYLPYADFHRSYYSSKTLKAVRAFVVDCDVVDSKVLSYLLSYLWGSLPLVPSYVVNSGKGVHFVYALVEPVSVRGRRYTLNELNKRIQESFEGIGKLDKHPIVHPYRFPGFMTKISMTATAFRSGRHYTLEELMKVFELKPVKAKSEESKTKKRKKAKVLYMPNGSKAFYGWVLRNLMKRPPIPGWRNKSFYALGVVSYKCKRWIDYQHALDMLDVLYGRMELLGLTKDFPKEEALKAFHSGYTPKAVRVRWKVLCEEFLNWEYRPNKRNGRKREEHVKLMNRIRLARCQSRWEELEEHIKRLIEQGYSKRKIAEMVGIHHSTLYRRFKHLFE